MALSPTEIALVVDEVAPLLTGGWIQKISQPLPRTIVWEIRRPGNTLRLLVCVTPETARLHLVTAPLPSPPSPPAFCQFLRARIQGARIESISQADNDRIVKLSLHAEGGPCSLVAELIGKKADILFVDQDGNVAATLGGNQDRIGRPYQPPAAGPRQQARSASSVEGDTQPICSGSLSGLIEARYRLLDEQVAREQRRQARLVSLRKAIKKEGRRLEALEQDLDKAMRYRGYARYGELIKANLGQIAKGQSVLTTVDYFDEALPEVTIPLDPTKSPQANMEDYFKKHRKYLMADRALRPRIDEAKTEIARLRKEVQAVQDGNWQPPAAKPTSTERSTSLRRPGQRRVQHRGPFRRFTSSDGFPIFVGRNARENDELTFGLAKSDDLWLHARGTPGSHVVVRLVKGTDPPPETLRDAATLALLYSDMKKSGKGEVIYTRRKWVKKAKGQAAGAVIVTQEKSVHVSLDRHRLEALKARSASEQ
jgi:predicted ribosome quality control (RQC) complex YloA/Tae2 family protein